jgi:hypothetical protein
MLVKDIPDDSMQEIYKRGIKKLVEIVSRIHSSEWSPTESKRAIEKIAKKLKETAWLLDACGSAQCDIEILHNKRGIPEPVIGLDGIPIQQSPKWEWPSYRSIRQDIELLTESARLAAEQLPDPRKNRALEFAARGFLHLRHDYGFPPISLYNNSDDVIEFESICNSAKIFLSRERYRGVLSESLKTFDPYFLQPGFELLYE